MISKLMSTRPQDGQMSRVKELLCRILNDRYQIKINIDESWSTTWSDMSIGWNNLGQRKAVQNIA